MTFHQGTFDAAQRAQGHAEHNDRLLKAMEVLLMDALTRLKVVERKLGIKPPAPPKPKRRGK